MKRGTKHSRVFILFAFYLISTALSFAKEIYFQPIHLEESLTQPSALSIFQDAQGAIWFGNDKLNCYDGHIIRTLRISSYLEQIEDDNIHALCGDGKGLIYLLADNHLLIYHLRQDRFEDTGIQARTLFFAQDTLYYTSGNRLFSYAASGASHEIHTLPESQSTIRCLLRKNGEWLIGASDGLYSLKGNHCQRLSNAANINCIFIDNRQRLWIGSATSGVYVEERGTWLHFKEGNPQYPLINNQVRCINQDEQGNIWIGTYQGLTVADSTLRSISHHTHHESLPYSLPNASVYDIQRDNQGGMWFATYYGGLSYFNPDTEKQTFYGVSRTSPNHLQGFLFGKMTEDENGRIYLATEHGGLNCIDPHTGSIEHFDENTHQLPFHTTKSVWYDIERQRLYVGTFQKGLYEMDAQKHFKSIGSDYLDNESKRIVIDLLPWKEHLLVITQGGLYQLDLVTQELSPLFTGPDIQERMQGVVRAAYVDGSERLWLSFAARELICWDLRKKKQLPIDTLTTLVGNQAVQSITGDSHGNIYFSITGYGLLQYNPDTQRTKTFNREQGVLPSDEPFQLLALPNGHLLITSLHTLTWLDPQSGKSIRRLLNKISPLHLLNRNGGLYRASNGILYIGGIEGVLALHEEAFATPKGDYSFFIDEISVNNHPLTPSANITLPHDQNNLNIKFTATNYRYANPNAYEYKLEGLDKQWTRTNLRTITYTTLAPGRYKLWIREMNGDKQIQLAIRIMPPLYASPYALLLYILLGAIGIYWLVRSYRSRTALKHFLEQERQEKIHAEKLNQLKLKFYVDISHELRTPLTIIISLLDRLIQDNRLPALFRNRLEKIRTYTQQMEQLVSEVLDFRRLEQGKMPFNPELQDIKPFLHDLYDSFIPYAEVKKIHYRWEVSDESVKLWFDPVQLRKAINNLLANAFKFTPEGGSIRIHCIQQSDRIEIEISDTGCGIPEAQKKQIFERFYQANHTHAGSGIGLSLSREIILQHQGSIEVESKEGKGTTFRITLRLNNPPLSQKPEAVVPSPAFQEANRPLTPAEVATPALDEDETDHPHTDGEKRNSVLLIEDNPELLNILSEAFSLHYNIYTASDGETGRQLAETRLPDLIVSDVMMPNLSGIDLCRRLKERLDTAHIPIILLTARTDLASTLEGLKAGANDYILKPFNMEVLLLKCHNLTRALQARRQAFQNDMQASPTELTTNPLDQSLLEESIRIIEANLENKDFNIDFWCREIRIGRTRLNSKIKNITGLTLNDFILQIKLRKCSELLLDERLTLTDIAYQCGFSNASYMGKCFKEKFGMTPMQYRNNKGK